MFKKLFNRILLGGLIVRDCHYEREVAQEPFAEEKK